MELQEIKNLQIPVVAIGGINETNLTKVMSTGVDGVAVISAILGEPDITTATKNLLALINRARGQRSKITYLDPFEIKGRRLTPIPSHHLVYPFATGRFG